jgi:hypothetical protein
VSCWALRGWGTNEGGAFVAGQRNGAHGGSGDGSWAESGKGGGGGGAPGGSASNTYISSNAAGCGGAGGASWIASVQMPGDPIRTPAHGSGIGSEPNGRPWEKPDVGIRYVPLFPSMGGTLVKANTTRASATTQNINVQWQSPQYGGFSGCGDSGYAYWLQRAENSAFTSELVTLYNTSIAVSPNVAPAASNSMKDNSGNWRALNNSATISFTDSNLPNTKSYYYRVAATNGCVIGAGSANVNPTGNGDPGSGNYDNIKWRWGPWSNTIQVRQPVPQAPTLSGTQPGTINVPVIDIASSSKNNATISGTNLISYNLPAFRGEAASGTAEATVNAYQIIFSQDKTFANATCNAAVADSRYTDSTANRLVNDGCYARTYQSGNNISTLSVDALPVNGIDITTPYYFKVRVNNDNAAFTNDYGPWSSVGMFRFNITHLVVRSTAQLYIPKGYTYGTITNTYLSPEMNLNVLAESSGSGDGIITLNNIYRSSLGAPNPQPKGYGNLQRAGVNITGAISSNVASNVNMTVTGITNYNLNGGVSISATQSGSFSGQAAVLDRKPDGSAYNTVTQGSTLTITNSAPALPAAVTCSGGSSDIQLYRTETNSTADTTGQIGGAAATYNVTDDDTGYYFFATKSCQPVLTVSSVTYQIFAASFGNYSNIVYVTPLPPAVVKTDIVTTGFTVDSMDIEWGIAVDESSIVRTPPEDMKYDIYYHEITSQASCGTVLPPNACWTLGQANMQFPATQNFGTWTLFEAGEGRTYEFLVIARDTVSGPGDVAKETTYNLVSGRTPSFGDGSAEYMISLHNSGGVNGEGKNFLAIDNLDLMLYDRIRSFRIHYNSQYIKKIKGENLPAGIDATVVKYTGFNCMGGGDITPVQCDWGQSENTGASSDREILIGLNATYPGYITGNGMLDPFDVTPNRLSSNETSMYRRKITHYINSLAFFLDENVGDTANWQDWVKIEISNQPLDNGNFPGGSILCNVSQRNLPNLNVDGGNCE